MFNTESDELIMDHIYPKIEELIDELEGLCPRYIAFGLMHRGAQLFEASVNNVEAARLCEVIAKALREEMTNPGYLRFLCEGIATRGRVTEDLKP